MVYTVLVVDDEKIERKGIIFLLKKLNYEFNIIEAVNGKSALDILKTQKVDILLTDVKMPFMDGIELITEIVAQKYDLKIIIFSGCSEFDYAKQAVRLGVSDYILKPVNPKEFDDTMNKVIGDIEVQRESMNLKTKSIEFMKEHILYMWVNGATIDDINGYCTSLIPLEFLYEFKRLVLLEFNNDFFGKNGVEFGNEVNYQFGNKYQYLNLNATQSLLLCRISNEDIKTDMEKFHDYIKKKYGADCYIAISSELADYHDVSGKMEEMELLMENKFYQQFNYIFSPNIDYRTQTSVEIDDDTLMKQMKQDLKMKDSESFKEHYKRLCSKYENQTDFSQMYIKFIFSNILKDIYSYLPDKDEKALNQEIDCLYRCSDFKGVLETVEKSINILESTFGNSPQMIHKEIDIIKKYIYEHYSEEIGVDQLADMVYMAPSYLSNIFKKETGQNLSKFIKEVRMEKAKDMLENTMKKIAQISVETGYPNVSYFCQSFREYFGVSPQKFRSGQEE